MKTPGPDHPMTIAQNPRMVRVRFQDHVIASSQGVMTLREADYPPVHYFPRADVETGFLSRTTHTTHCPYKGDATYYSFLMNGDLVENVAWSYEAPYPAAEDVRGMLAFYPDKVEVYEVSEDEVEHRHRHAFAAAWPAADSGAQ
jgi:uncharacterized protein (DUF427 family)